MGAIIGSLLLLVTLAALLQECLARYERGRTFDEWRVWLATVMVVATYQLPTAATYLLRSSGESHPGLKFLADTRGSMTGLFLWYPTIFGVQWIVYRLILKDTTGGTLSPRGNIWLAAVPTLFGLSLWLVIIAAVGGLFFVVGLSSR
jgi:hypothetical protein